MPGSPFTRVWLGSPFWPISDEGREEGAYNYSQSFCLSTCYMHSILDKVIIYLEIQAVQASPVPQYLPDYLEIQETRVPLAQGSQWVLEALADLANQ